MRRNLVTTQKGIKKNNNKNWIKLLLAAKNRNPCADYMLRDLSESINCADDWISWVFMLLRNAKWDFFSVVNELQLSD